MKDIFALIGIIALLVGPLYIHWNVRKEERLEETIKKLRAERPSE